MTDEWTEEDARQYATAFREGAMKRRTETNKQRSITMDNENTFFLPVQQDDPAGGNMMVWAIVERATGELWCVVGRSLQKTVTVWRALEIDHFARSLG